MLRGAVFSLMVLGAGASAQAQGWISGQGENVVEVDAKGTGQITKWISEGKTLVSSGTPQAPLELRGAGGQVWKFQASASEALPEGTGVRVTGSLKSEGGVEIPAALTYRVEENGGRIVVGVETSAVPKDVVVEKYGWTLPLDLNPRKRVFFLSDYGLRWDTRYFFQLSFDPASGKGKEPSLLKEPDRTEWRFFGLDQFGAQGYRLWKSESDTTMPLVMHEGRVPAPIAQVYDEKGGVTVEYAGLKGEEPRSLRVDASGGGAVTVLFQPDSAEAVKGAAFARQEIILVAEASEKAIKDEQAALLTKYAPTFSAPVDPKGVMQEAKWIVNAPLDGTGYVVGGYPFAKGELRDVSKVGVEVAGAKVATQARTLGYWPDGSVKWALLVFPINEAKAVKECAEPRISLRNEKFLPVKIVAGEPAAAAGKSLTVKQGDGGVVTVANGALKVELGQGENWLRRLEYQGSVIVDAAKPEKRAVAYCHFLEDPQAVHPFALNADGGVLDAGVLKVDKVEVEQAGPLRGVVRLEGLTTNREPTRIVLRLEFFAGKADIRVAHTSVLRFKDPRRTFLAGLGLDLPLPEGAKGAGQQVAIIQDSSVNQRTEIDGKAVAAAPVNWLRVAGPKSGMTAVLRNFREMAPKALSADFGTGRFKIELWPDKAPPMDVRRYSNYLHEGMLESPIQYPTAKDWVATEFYAKDPVFGISRTHEALLAFDDGKKAVAGETLAADYQSPALLYAGWNRYAETGVILPSSTEQAWPRAWAAWTRLTRFFLYHREFHGWYGYWNYGDFRHRFRGGFGWTHPAEVLTGLLNGSIKDDAEKMQKERRLDYVPANDWNFDNGAYGWSNTEGLPGMFLQHEYLRHGNRVVYFAAEAMGRYARDVITRQEGRWLGMGTRHGVQPWSDGNHEERQSTITEYRLLYFLSGDERSRDVVENLYQNVYQKGEVKSRATHSARLGGFLFHWELTGNPAEGEQLARYINLFLANDGLNLEPKVKFPGPVENGKPDMLNSGSMFFHTFGGMHALLEYQQITGDEKIQAALIHMADAIIKKPIIEKGLLGNGDFSWPPVAFAALHAADPEPYRAFLRLYLDKGGWRNAYQPVTENEKQWTGPAAFMASPVALTFFWANWAPYITDAIGKEEHWTPEIAKSFATWEDRQPVFRATSWQSDYDNVPGLWEYLAPQQPWSAATPSPQK